MTFRVRWGTCDTLRRVLFIPFMIINQESQGSSYFTLVRTLLKRVTDRVPSGRYLQSTTMRGRRRRFRWNQGTRDTHTFVGPARPSHCMSKFFPNLGRHRRQPTHVNLDVKVGRLGVKGVDTLPLYFWLECPVKFLL